MRTSPRRPRRIVVRSDEVRRLARERLGTTSGTSFAEHIGLEASTVNRVLAGHYQPSGTVIATMLDALDAKFEEVFAIQHAANPTT